MEDLRRRIEELERMVAGLANRAPDTSLRARCRCMACGEARILHVPRLNAASMPLAIHVKWTNRVVGQFEAYVCTGCGKAEIYVSSLEGIEVDGHEVKEHREWASDGSGPYR